MAGGVTCSGKAFVSQCAPGMPIGATSWQKVLQYHGMVLAGSSTDFGKLITEETEKWGKVIRAANIKAE